jgi:phosphatidylinositol-binding clathrin assembly protein
MLTTGQLAAPKSKYIEPILSATNGGESGVAEVFRTLQLRLRDSTWTIVFKALIVVHLMIREGQPEITLRYVSESPKRIAINTFTEGEKEANLPRCCFVRVADQKHSSDTRPEHPTLLRIPPGTSARLP